MTTEVLYIVFLRFKVAPASLLHLFMAANRFGHKILHRAQQSRCRASCNFSRRLDNFNVCYGRTRFREMLV